MGLNDIQGNWYKGVFDVLKVNNKFTLKDQALVANQGTSYFVDSGSGSDTNDGLSWDTALATLDAANNKCTANQGDIIYVAEGHAESWTTTGAKVVLDTAGVTVIGLGVGSDRPTFSFGHTGATWTISAANVVLYNLLFLTTVDSVVTYGTISGADCKLINCESRDATDKEVLDGWTVTTTANRLGVHGYRHVGYIGGNANDSIFQLTGADDFVFDKCTFLTQSGTTAGSAIIELASQCLRGVIDNSLFYVDGKSDFSDDIVDTAGTSTVIVRNCFDLEVGSKFSGGGNGTSFSLAGDDVSSVIDALYGSNGIFTFPTSAAPANNVSIAEVLRDAWDVLRNGTGGSEPGTNKSIIDVIKQNSDTYNNDNYLTVTADLTSATWNTVASHEVFTVTGLVRMKVIAEVTGTGDDTSGDTSTIQLGTESATNGWIAATQVDDLAAGEVWADATPTETDGNYSSLVFDKVVNAVDIGYEIAGEAATAGTIVFHCWWTPLNSTGAVVVGDGSSLT